jgi:hypothetical protein
MTYRSFQKMGQRLTDELAPIGDRTAILAPASVIEFLDATKGLFAAQSNLNEQFKEGMMGRTGGLDVGENTLLPPHTTGTMAGSPLTFGTTLGLSTTANSWVSTTALSVTGATATGTVLAGDIITLSGVYAVHPESKANSGRLQQFVVQASVTMTTATSTYTVTVKPALMYGSGNAFQNCVLSGVSDTTGLTVTRLGASNTAFGAGSRVPSRRLRVRVGGSRGHVAVRGFAARARSRTTSRFASSSSTRSRRTRCPVASTCCGASRRSFRSSRCVT